MSVPEKIPRLVIPTEQHGIASRDSFYSDIGFIADVLHGAADAENIMNRATVESDLTPLGIVNGFAPADQQSTTLAVTRQDITLEGQGATAISADRATSLIRFVSHTLGYGIYSGFTFEGVLRKSGRLSLGRVAIDDLAPREIQAGDQIMLSYHDPWEDVARWGRTSAVKGILFRPSVGATQHAKSLPNRHYGTGLGGGGQG